jgi:hypothetical protein
MEMKITLSTPNTNSSTMSVKSAIQDSGETTQDKSMIFLLKEIFGILTGFA